ncbi:hypothetical protein K503DRAFT_863392 [Rhizopogon vinicolor AM-OR11-026]|uniref:Uncharacterized protein n=1 Tax=Rhizopogon vinicolor AM-OR11-026 TaxID=1314800 RepID=A0A1B7NB13_9AGAM|nr:hypothetical protein K503DRAFT_863392 [Rhizopogon vinicolor AM-OR11-026]
MVFGLFTRKPDTSPFQLHTPTPSISNSESLAAAPPISPSPPPNSLTTDLDAETEVTDPTVLYDLVRSVPPQTLHTYTLAHLRPLTTSQETPPSPRTLTALTNFFSSLSPPPQLHCARCHSSFFELSNTDTSCRVPHDDESALVDRSAYETLWGCCGQSVEGTGDMGPPNGWCYEGRHTTDIKRARFRADSTIHDDKLVSCDTMGCHGRKRKRSTSVSSDDMSISMRKKDKGKAKAKSIDESSPKSATTRKPASKASTRSTPKPLSKTSSTNQLRSRPLLKSHLHQSHVASPTVDGESISGSDAPALARHKSTTPRDSDPPREPDIPVRPPRERTNTNTSIKANMRPTADEPRRPRTRSAAREERSLSRPRASARGSSVRVVLRERSAREKEKGVSESDGDERGRGRGREVKKRRVG